MIDFSKGFPERVRIATEAVAREKAMRKARDPFGGALDDDAIGKTIHHHYENGHRVTVNSPGHHTHGHAGVITDNRNDSRLEVKLDSGHTIHAHEGDLMPEDFAPAGESVKIIKRALAANAVSDHDYAMIVTALEKISTGRYATDPFGETFSDSPFHILRILAEKYDSADSSNVLAKRAKGVNFQVGDRVKDGMGWIGKITRITATHADIDYANGKTGTCVFDYLESAA